MIDHEHHSTSSPAQHERVSAHLSPLSRCDAQRAGQLLQVAHERAERLLKPPARQPRQNFVTYGDMGAGQNSLLNYLMSSSGLSGPWLIVESVE